MAKVAVQCSADTIVVKIATFAKPETVASNATMETKKQIERKYIENFLTRKNLGLEIKSIEDSETPDFVLRTMDKSISVEMTKLIDIDLKFIEEFRKSVIGTANKTFREKYDKELYCLIELLNIRLGEKRLERQHQIEKYGAKLFERVEKIYLDNHSNTDFEVTIEDINDFDDIVTRLHVKTSEGFDHWQYFGAHRVDGINMEWLIKRIKEKEEKINNYRQSFDENWLLFISNTGTKPTAHRFDLSDFSQIKTKFEKVFVYKSMEDNVIEIV